MAISRGSWDIYVQDSGSVWVLDDTIYRPNETMPIGIDSRLTPFNLANGDIGTVISSTKYSSSAISMMWRYIYYTDDILTTLETYIKNATYIRITDHLGNNYDGTFKKLETPFLVGEDNYFDISATFFRH